MNTNPQAQGKQEFYGVQALRAVAALLVVAGHSTDFLMQQNGAVPPTFIHLHGPAGVDIFFVISGFVMMVSSQRLKTRPHASRLFLWRRIVRIVPLYWLLTLLRIVIVCAAPGLVIHPHTGIWNTIASFLFIPSRSFTGEIRPLIPVGWTLNFEMFFYLIFAAGLTCGRRMMRVFIPLMLLVSLIGVFRMPHWPAWTALADPIVLEFLAGVGLGALVIRGKTLRVFPAILCALAGCVGFIVLQPGLNPLSRPLTWGISAFLLVSAIVALEPVITSALPPWLLLLGDASYSIYLFQTFIFPILHLAIQHIRPNFVHQQPVEAGLLMIVSSLITTSIAGVLLYRIVERPMTSMLRHRIGVERPHPVTSP